MSLSVLIAAGGTGGHMIPAHALLACLRQPARRRRTIAISLHLIGRAAAIAILVAAALAIASDFIANIQRIAHA
jgi:UDP-N-acetylglucosamine:LPS N-acetylglucosamine transferase